MASCLLVCAGMGGALEAGDALPRFDRDTVLVWNIDNRGETARFVVRIAEFSPNRFIEWENSSTQGTIFMPEKAVKGAKTFISARLFEAGVDSRGKDSTTLWLSRQIYRDLKSRHRIKVGLDSVDGWMTVAGFGEMVVEVNREPLSVPVMKVEDDRGQERWFLDMEDNPLLVRHLLKGFDQSLKSITTDRANTLRWIKGKKLNSPR